MEKIPLSRGGYTLVDDENYEFLSQWKWYTGTKGYIQGKIDKIPVLMHRVVTGCKKGELVDHRDGDKRNNQKSNLRICSNRENLRNRGKTRANKSGYKGVHWDKKGKKWNAHIMVNYKSIYLGVYSDKKEAARAYNEAALKYHGEFAKLNSVEERKQ